MRNLKRALSLAVASVMLLGMMVVGTGAASYGDVDAQDNLEAIEVLQAVGIMTGDDQGNFNPDQLVTRGEMAVIMCKLLDLTPGGTHPFTDVPDWANGYVAAIYANGVTGGTSATTYGTDDPLTAVQAALMVMKPLGYFGYQGEFGESWELATVKQANEIDLYDGLSVYTNQALTRNDVAQMVLNALECDVMIVREEGGMSVDGNGISVNVKPTYDKTPAENNSGFDYANRPSNATMQLCEKLYGDDLRKNSDTVDAFGRSATQWVYDSKTITTPNAADLTYTKEVSGKDIYNDLGRPTTVTLNTIDSNNDGVGETAGIYVDGTLDTLANHSVTGLAINSTNAVKVGGNGVQTEVYYNKDTKVATIVVINTYASEVTDCEENDDGKYDITVVGESETYESAVAYEVDDVVLYTKAGTELKSMELAEYVEGTVTKVTTGKSFVIGGNTYEYNKNIASADKLVMGAVDNDAKMYLDSYGYVIKKGTATSSDDYAVVLGYTNGTWTGETDYEAKLLFADGIVDTVPVDSSYSPVGKLNHVVTYTVDSEGVYSLTDVSDGTPGSNTAATASAALKVENGTAGIQLDSASANYTANSKTVFFLYDSVAKKYEAYVGIKNVPSLAAAAGTNYSYTYDANGTLLKAVYLSYAGSLKSGTSGDYASFIFVNGNESQVKDTDLGNYYVLKAVVDNEITEIMVTPTAYSAISAQGGKVVSSMTVNNDGIVTNVVTETDGIDANGDGYVIDTGNYNYTTPASSVASDVVAAEDDVITLAFGKAYAYDDDVAVYEYDVSDKAFSAKTIKALTTGIKADIFAQIEGNVVVAIYYIVG